MIQKCSNFQRQEYMDRPHLDLDKEKITIQTIFLRICRFLYSCIPMTLYMICLYVVAVSRESLGTLTFIMVGMIHPAISVTFGISARSVYTLMFQTCLKTFFQRSHIFTKFILRFFTLTLNAYLSLIACCMYYLFEISIEFRDSSEWILIAMNDFKNVIFNACICPTIDVGDHCVNYDTNFQNYLTFLPNKTLLQLFMLIPISFHFIHSVFLFKTPPIPLLDFILGNQEPTPKLDEMEELEYLDSEADIGNVATRRAAPRRGVLMINFGCSLLVTFFIFGIIIFPNTYDYLFTRTIKKHGKLYFL